MSAESPKHVPHGDKKLSIAEKLLVGAYAADIFAFVGTVGVTIGVADGSIKRIGIGAGIVATEVVLGAVGMWTSAKLIDRSTRRRESSLPKE